MDFILYNKSNELVYCVKGESKFSKGISGEAISSKAPANTSCVFHAETMGIRRFHIVSASSQYGTHSVFLGL